MKIRIFDVKEWRTLYSSYFLKKCELKPDDIQKLLTNGYYNMHFAMAQGTVIGLLIYAKLPNNIFYIEYLCINKEFQKYGIGKNLIKQFLQNLPNDASCGLNCENSVIGYYQKFGFNLDEKILDCYGQKYFTMTKGNVTGEKIIELMFNLYWIKYHNQIEVF